MPASTSSPLTNEQIRDASNKAKALAISGTKAIESGQFVFFAAFDGTNNTKDNPAYSGDTQKTSVGQLATQYDEINGGSPNLRGEYYPGPGTPGTLPGSSWNPTQVTAQIRATAGQAYEDFREQALTWLAADPNRSPADITTVATGFSRGGPTAVAFTQLLAERGLTAADGTVLIPPLNTATGIGGVPVAGLLGIDNVSTGYLGDLRIPQNVNANNIVMAVAENEFRRMFPNDDYSNDPRVQTFGLVGNHGDLGGFYDNGLGALSLDAQTQVLRNFGLVLADVPADRQFDPSEPVVIHNEAVDNRGNRIWDEYGTPGNRLERAIAGPVLNRVYSADVLSVTAVGNGDQTLTQRISYKNGDQIYRVLDARGNPLITAMPGEVLARDPQTGTYTVQGASAQDTTTYNPQSQTYTQTSSAGVVIAGNNATGEYLMRIPREDGNGYTQYSRAALEGGGWHVTQVDVDNTGTRLYEFSGVQASLDGAIRADSEALKDPASGQLIHTSYTYNPNSADYQTLSTVTDADGAVVRSVATDISFNDLGEQTRLEYLTDATGTVRTVYNDAGQPVSRAAVESGTDNLGFAVAATTSFLSLVQAIQAGKPLPMVVAGVNTLAALQAGTGSVNTSLAGAQSVLGAATSLYNLSVAWKQGDATGVLASGASSLYYGGQAYAYMAGYSNLGAAAAGGAIGSELAGAIGAAGQAMPYLNLVNSLVHGDAMGVAMATLSIAFPVAAPFIGLATAIFGMFKKDPPPPWGNGQFTFNADGSVRVEAVGAHGGYEAVYNTLAAYQGALGSMVGQYNAAAPKAQIGLIANRMGNLSFNGYEWTLSTIDHDSGATRVLHYDRQGKVVDAPVGSAEYFRSMGEQYIYSALDSGALAPVWEVQTARMQSALGDPQAGLTEVQRAQRNGQYVGAQHLTSSGSNGQPGTWRVIGLDLGGDGIQTVDRSASNVVLDVDNTGYGKKTAWIGASDGMLVLDRNFNGMIDNGTELFGNTQVALGAQGLKALAVVDANVDGNIDQRDAVYSQLRVWQDANGNGLVDNGEAHSLGDMGISAIHYQRGSFERNGQTRQIGSVDLAVDSVGLRVEPVQGGIRIADTDGHVSVLVTKADDLSNVAPGKDGVQAIEDVQLDILTATLLANDQVLGSDKALTVTAVGGAQHGKVWLDAAGVHFLGDRNYDGKDAGFSYTVQDANGNMAQAQVAVGMTAVNDAPTVQAGYTTKAIYGYSYDSEMGTRTPIYTPTWGYNPTTHQYGWITDPIAYEVDPNSGHLLISDPDDTVFSITQSHAPLHGSVAINADGSWVFTPSEALGGKDAFEVTVIDGHGGRTTQVIEVDLPEPWNGGGEGGGDGVGDGGTGDGGTGDGGTGGDGGSESEGEGEGEGGGGDPLVLDLDRNGIVLQSSQDSQAFYDIRGDGWRYRTGWITGGDGLLAFDANGDGQIAGKGELSFAQYKAGAKTDLEGLQAFDSNGDGKVSALDTLYQQLRVWRDANGNGLSEAGEVQTLTEAGIQSIGLQSDHQFRISGDNVIHGNAQVTLQDGSTIAMADVTLAVSQQALLVHADGTSEVVTRSNVAPGIEVTGSAADDVLVGTVGNDHLVAMAGNDFLADDQGNDLIESGAGRDVVYSGADNDVVLLGDGDDTAFAGLADDLAHGNDGNDALFMEAGNDVAFGGAGNDLLDGGSGADVLSGDEGDDQLAGGSGNDALFGGDGNDGLLGGDGNDWLQGDAGNDVLDGGAGADQMAGGTGDDVYDVDDAGDTVIEQAAGGHDRVRTSLDGYRLGDHLEDLALTAAVNDANPNSGADSSQPRVARVAHGNELDNRLFGNAYDNTLYGGAGHDTLDGWTGRDTLVGGTGDDTYVVDDVSDRVIERADEGMDRVRSSVDHTLSAHVEHLILTGSAALTGSGNDLDNRLQANNAGNALRGLAGNDTLLGGEGDDVLDGGSGADAMAGGAGDDTYIVDDAGDSVTEQAGQGTDRVRASVSHALSDGVEHLELTGDQSLSGTGNDRDNVLKANDAGNTLVGGLGNDILQGGAGNDLLDGGSGADQMAGGAGDDTYIVDSANDAVSEAAGQGHDQVRSSVDHTLSRQVENLTLTGTRTLVGQGNDLDNVITANDAGNTLSGGSGHDTLMGGAGHDCLDGGAGSDDMAGGQGNDTYMVDSSGDLVTEREGQGIDQVRTSVSHTLSANVEHLMLTGTAVLTGTGNALDNVLAANDAGNNLSGGAGNDTLLGGAGRDLLDGGTGADAMAGGAGNDIYIVDDAGDTVTERAGEGTDLVRASVNHTLSSQVEALTLTGTAVLTGVGNALDNTLKANEVGNRLFGGAGNDTVLGGSGNDTLDGGTGADAMTGGGGDDTYVVDATGDAVIEQAGQGRDAVQSSINFTLGAHVENLTLTGTNALTGLGNGLDNVLTANDAGNTLDGGLGADRLNGGIGDDTLKFSADAVWGTGATSRNALTGQQASAAGKQRCLDQFNGGAGSDSLLGTAGADVVLLDDGTSTSALLASIERIGTGAGDDLINLTSTRFAAGSIWVDAGVGNDVVWTASGNDWLDGGTGADTMAGGAGDDTYVLDNAQDKAYELAGQGNDLVRSSVSHTLNANIENLTLTGSSAISGTGNELNNILIGNDAGNTLSGGAGNDWLDGGAGRDVLSGGTGSDTYVMGRGHGVDTIQDCARDGAVDVLRFAPDITSSQLWFTRSCSDLQVTVIGTGDQVVIEDWFLGSAYQVEQFKAGDGKTLLNTQVNHLVSAMAAFAPPAAGQTQLTPRYQNALSATLASNWK